jgi:hypothetical protein
MVRVGRDLYSENKSKNNQDEVIEDSYSVRCIQAHSQPAFQCRWYVVVPSVSVR